MSLFGLPPYSTTSHSHVRTPRFSIILTVWFPITKPLTPFTFVVSVFSFLLKTFFAFTLNTPS